LPRRTPPAGKFVVMPERLLHIVAPDLKGCEVR
jgi:hypothetical protein